MLASATTHQRVDRTGGMSSQPKKKPAYDPGRQWGLKPEREADGATYVVQGHVISGSGSDSRSLYVAESVGRDAQAKAARKISAVDSEKALQKLLQRDKEGTKALVSAREFSKRNAEMVVKNGSKRQKAEKAEQKPMEDDEVHKPRRNAYSAQLIRQIGFDPTAKEGRKVKDTDVQSKV